MQTGILSCGDVSCHNLSSGRFVLLWYFGLLYRRDRSSTWSCLHITCRHCLPHPQRQFQHHKQVPSQLEVWAFCDNKWMQLLPKGVAKYSSSSVAIATRIGLQQQISHVYIANKFRTMHSVLACTRACSCTCKAILRGWGGGHFALGGDILH